MSKISTKALLTVCVSALFVAAQMVSVADAKPSRSGSAASRGKTQTSIASHNRGGNKINADKRRDVKINKGGNRGGNNVNIGGGHNNINIDVDNDWNRGRWDNHWHPVRTAAVVGATVAVTRAVVGTRVYVLPSNTCKAYTYTGVYYYNCGDDWYSPQYVGTQVTYVVVARPY
jgi:hypothetical protein